MKKYKLKQWYKIDGTNVIFYAKQEIKNDLWGYGITFSGEWFEGNFGSLKHGLITIATEKEVKEVLIQERYKRYSVGDRVKYLDTGIGKIDGRSFIYDDCVIYSSNHPNNHDIIYKDGKWAEVIKTMYLTKKQAEDMITSIKNDGNEYKIMNSIMNHR